MCGNPVSLLCSGTVAKGVLLTVCCSVSDSEGDWEPSGKDAPDSAGHPPHLKSNGNDATTPCFTAKEDNFVAFSTLVEGAAVDPLQPVTEQTGEDAGDMKPTGKQRRRRAPKAIPIKAEGIQYSDFNSFLHKQEPQIFFVKKILFGK